MKIAGPALAEGARIRVCAGEPSCTTVHVPRRPPGDGVLPPGACGAVSCSMDRSGVLRVWLSTDDGERLDGVPVRVTVIEGREHVAEGTGVLRYEPGTGACRCPIVQADVTVG